MTPRLAAKTLPERPSTLPVCPGPTRIPREPGPTKSFVWPAFEPAALAPLGGEVLKTSLSDEATKEINDALEPD
jgi:hypothetical protein